jgi:hypothetical protein
MPHPSLTLVADAGDSQTIYNAVGVASWKKRVVHCEIKKYGSSKGKTRKNKMKYIDFPVVLLQKYALIFSVLTWQRLSRPPEHVSRRGASLPRVVCGLCSRGVVKFVAHLR